MKRLLKPVKIIYNKNQGLTIVELLLTVSIFIVLYTLVIIWLDPFRLTAESRNSRRWRDINSISIAIHSYLVDNSELPGGISEDEKQLGTSIKGCNEVCRSTGTECLDLSDDLEEYLKYIPQDPLNNGSDKTYYSVVVNKHGIITVRACNVENGKIIELSR